MFRNEITKHRL